MSDVKHIYLVRHGQSRANLTGVREADAHAVPLTDEGYRQAQVIAERFKTIPIEVVLTSPYIRAHDTGEEISRVNNVPIEILDQAYERTFPTAVAGKDRNDPEVREYYKHFDEQWRMGAAVDDGEGFAEVLARVNTVTRILEERPEQHIALTTHGLFTKLFVAHHILGDYLTPDLFVNAFVFRLMSTNTGITYFQVHDGTSWRLRAWNDYAHLGEL